MIVTGGTILAVGASSMDDANASPPARLVHRSTSFARALMPLVVVIGGILFALSVGKSILMPIFIAMLLSLLLSPLVGMMERVRIPTSLGALIVVLVLAGGLSWFIVHNYQPGQAWVANSERDLDKVQKKLSFLRRPIEAIQAATQKVGQITDGGKAEASKAPARAIVVEEGGLGSMLEKIEPYLVGGLTMIVLLYFLLASGDTFLRKLIRVVPTLRNKRTAVDIARGIQDELAHYLSTVGMINAGLGLAVMALSYWAGLPNPLLWGCMVAVLNFVPYVGPLTSLIVLAFISLVTFDDMSQALKVPLGFAIITLIEGNLIQPIVVGQRLQLNPVVIFLSVAFWGWLWGIGGVILAVPILVVIRICCEHIPSWNTLGEFLAQEVSPEAKKAEE